MKRHAKRDLTGNIWYGSFYTEAFSSLLGALEGVWF
jgi:hypothetical protein